MSTHLSHRSLSRLISRLDQYASTYQLIQKLFSEDSASTGGTLSNFDSKGSFRSTALLEGAPSSFTVGTSLLSKNLLATDAPKGGAEGTYGTYGADPDGYKDSVYLSELSTFCLQEYN